MPAEIDEISYDEPSRHRKERHKYKIKLSTEQVPKSVLTASSGEPARRN